MAPNARFKCVYRILEHIADIHKYHRKRILFRGKMNSESEFVYSVCIEVCIVRIYECWRKWVKNAWARTEFFSIVLYIVTDDIYTLPLYRPISGKTRFYLRNRKTTYNTHDSWLFCILLNSMTIINFAISPSNLSLKLHPYGCASFHIHYSV